LIKARADATLCPLGTNCIVLFGGVHLNVFQDIFCFDVDKKAWSWGLLDVPLEPRQSHAMEIIVHFHNIFFSMILFDFEFA
jgi:hypothetical protein